MTKRTESKYKIDRRLQVNLWGRAKSPLNKREYGPGQHGQRRKKPSDYGVQLMAKQKLNGYYGNISERQFRKYYAEALRRKGDNGENLVGILECRLDTIVYRMKLVPTVFAAFLVVAHPATEIPIATARILRMLRPPLGCGPLLRGPDRGRCSRPPLGVLSHLPRHS